MKKVTELYVIEHLDGTGKWYRSRHDVPGSREAKTREAEALAQRGDDVRVRPLVAGGER